jgi:hypothetical protein
MSTGGSIQDFSIRGRTFPVAADADATRKLGGFENALEMNGDGATARLVKTRVGWSVGGVVLSINDTRGDQEFLQEILDGVEADEDGFYTIAITFANGATYQGRGTIVEGVEGSSQNTTVGVSLAGPGTLTKQ